MNHSLQELGRQARRLNRAAGAKRVPCLFALTDPDRAPDPAALARALPRGGVLIYRHFGRPDLTLLDKAIRTARQRGALVLIGADWRLAAWVRADGVHLPERMSGMAARLRRRRPDWLVTAAVHSPRALRRARAAHVALLSPVFPTASASGGRPIGARRATGWARAAALPVMALGGVTAARAAQLSGFSGLAAIEAWLMASRTR